MAETRWHIYEKPVEFILALSITAETTITTAIVRFKHTNSKGIVRYEAYVDSLKGKKCSVAASAKDLTCTLRGIGEAVKFYIVARACFAGENNCESSIDVRSQTKLRGNEFVYFILTYWKILIKRLAFAVCRCKWFKNSSSVINIIESDCYLAEKFCSRLFRCYRYATNIHWILQRILRGASQFVHFQWPEARTEVHLRI